jgi:Ethanolamine utilization protein EutJ (predicted chaperonin)
MARRFVSFPDAPMRFSSAGTLLAIALAAPAGAQTLTIVTDPPTATIYRLKVQDNSLVSIGVGNAKINLDKKDPNTIVVRQEGFRDVTRSFPKDRTTRTSTSRSS